MKLSASRSLFAALMVLGAIVPANAQVNVTQYHNHSSRDGLYTDSAFTQSAAANLTRDLNFNGTIVGNVFAQPLTSRAVRAAPWSLRSPNRIMCMHSTL